MISADPQQLAVAGMLCGVLATWLLGAALHARFLRMVPNQIKQFYRVLLPLHVDQAMGHVVLGINHSPHFIANLTGKLEGVVTAAVRRTSDHDGLDSAQLACRVEDFGTESQVRVRLDFTPAIERARTRGRLVLTVIWPAWIALVVCAVLLPLSIAEQPGPWWALNLLHAIYPLIAVIALHVGFHKTRSLIVHSVGAVVENLRFLPH
jgi:hypothetical protein